MKPYQTEMLRKENVLERTLETTRKRSARASLLTIVSLQDRRKRQHFETIIMSSSIALRWSAADIVR